MLILFYNLKFNTRYWFYEQYQLQDLGKLLPADINITDNKKLFNKADVVIFDTPHLPDKLEGELIKQENQLWVSWNMESEINYPWLNYPQIKALFDITMGYRSDNDIFVPYFSPYYYNQLKSPVREKDKNICMFISSAMNKSKRIDYVQELVKYINIDSYGRILNNCKLNEDKGFTSKIDVIGSYKFTIAFENAIEKDYVTEKFYEPLVGGSVPIYLGSPNVEDFAPNNNSFINVNDFNSPKELAYCLKEYIEDTNKYKKLFNWKKETFTKSFEELISIQNKSPFLRLIDKIEEMQYSKLTKNYFVEPIKIPFVSGNMISPYIRNK